MNKGVICRSSDPHVKFVAKDRSLLAVITVLFLAFA